MIALNVKRDENDKFEITASIQGSYAEIIDGTIAGTAAILMGAHDGTISYDTALVLLRTIMGDILDNKYLEEG